MMSYQMICTRRNMETKLKICTLNTLTYVYVYTVGCMGGVSEDKGVII